MALKLSELANNIQQSVSGLQSYFDNTNKFANGQHIESGAGIEKFLSKIVATNWNKSFPYAFSVVKNQSDSTTHRLFTPFILPINPQDLSQDENFAITIRPTQGGTMVDHGGNKYKNLIISGTTGVHPFKGAGGVSKFTGQAIFQPKELKYASGFEVFLRLRNYFRSYYQYKKELGGNFTEARDAKLVFKNFKDGEFLIIEVPTFSMKRSSSKPFQYEYNITARVIGNLEFRQDDQESNDFQTLREFDAIIENALSAIDEARGIFLRTSDILRQVEATFDQTVLEPLRRAALTAKAFLGVGTNLADLGPRIIRRSLTALDTAQILLGIRNRQNTQRNQGTLDPRLENIILPTDIVSSARQNGSELILNLPDDSPLAIETSTLPIKIQQELRAEQEEFIDLPRSFYSNLKENIERIKANAEDAFNFNDSLFDNIFNRTPTLVPETTKRATDQEIEALDGLTKAIEGLEFILSTNAFFKSSYTDRINSVNQSFTQNLGLDAKQAVKEIILPKGTTLERLALNELGDARRWVEIIELNNLKPPYISNDNTLQNDSVKKPGDKILLPQPISNGFATTPINRETFVLQGLSELEKNLGVDLKLSTNYDLQLSNSNDLVLIKGIDNAIQSILLKLVLEKQEILDHPSIGVGLNIGSKAPSLIEVQTEIIRALSQDPRFERIDGLSITQENSVFRLQFEVKVKNVDIPVPVDLKI